MANFTVNPAALVFGKALVVGSIPGLYPTPPALQFALTNTSGSSVTITGYGFSNTTEGDAVTTPSGQLPNSDFTVVPTAGVFPVTVANGASQLFTVTYSPKRKGSSFGDIRSALMVLFAGNKALSNGGQILNSAGEVISEKEPKLVIVGVGGGVREEAFNFTVTHPIMGMPPNFTLADLDTGRHGGMYPDTSAIALITAATAPTTGTYQNVNARGVQVLVFFQDISQGCDLDIFANTSGGDVNVGHFPGLNYANVGGLFIGNNEGVDLQGLQLKAQISNLTNNHTISVGVVVTG